MSQQDEAVFESAEQTMKGVRFKETESGRARTVALPARVVDDCARPGSGRRRSFRESAFGKTHVLAASERSTIAAEQSHT